MSVQAVAHKAPPPPVQREPAETRRPEPPRTETRAPASASRGRNIDRTV
jgi:hypothetical protein